MELRTLRLRIDAQLSNRHDWATKGEELIADLDRYDRRLLKVAVMLGVKPPPTRRGEELLLNETERLQLEVSLRNAGLNVRDTSIDADPKRA
jgi:hypothetical protein